MKLLLAISLIFNFWCATAIIDLEQYRYATSLQIAGVGDSCQIYEEKDKMKVDLCLQEKTSRTSSVSDLAYGLGIL